MSLVDPTNISFSLSPPLPRRDQCAIAPIATSQAGCISSRPGLGHQGSFRFPRPRQPHCTAAGSPCRYPVLPGLGVAAFGGLTQLPRFECDIRQPCCQLGYDCGSSGNRQVIHYIPTQSRLRGGRSTLFMLFPFLSFYRSCAISKYEVRSTINQVQVFLVNLPVASGSSSFLGAGIRQ